MLSCGVPLAASSHFWPIAPTSPPQKPFFLFGGMKERNHGLQRHEFGQQKLSPDPKVTATMRGLAAPRGEADARRLHS